MSKWDRNDQDSGLRADGPAFIPAPRAYLHLDEEA
jgi:hypothetical protein